MNGFLIRKQDDSQIPTIHFIDLGPAANSTVLLYHFANRMFDCLENPLFPDYGSIRSRAHRQEVGAEFHWHDIAKGYHPLQPEHRNIMTHIGTARRPLAHTAALSSAWSVSGLEV
jgi:hypothetical protein